MHYALKIGSHLYSRLIILLLFVGAIPPKSGTVVVRKGREEEVEEEGVKSLQRKISTHSIRRNDKEYRSFISDDRFLQVITVNKSVIDYMYMLLSSIVSRKNVNLFLPHFNKINSTGCFFGS